MSRVLCFALFAMIVASPVVSADESKKDAAAGCPVCKKVEGLLASWKAAIEESKSVPEADRIALATKLSGLAKECPVGSRIGPTLVDTRDVLASLVAAEEANAKHCPLKAAVEKGGPEAAACKSALEIVAARSMAIQHLHQLAVYATGACCASGPDNKTTEVVSTTPVSDKDLQTRITALEASWKKAGPEFAALTPEKRQAIGAGLTEACKACKTVALIPPSVIALADGFALLDSIHAKMDAWAAANPTCLASLSEEAKTAYQTQKNLVTSTSAALKIARETIKSGCPEGCCEPGCCGDKAEKSGCDAGSCDKPTEKK